MADVAQTDRTTVVWFRRDLRTDDHKPLRYASERGRVVPVFVVGDDHQHKYQAPSLGQASQWWLHHSLQSLARVLEELGSALVFRLGDPIRVLREICQEVGADQVAIHESTDPLFQADDDFIEQHLERAGIEVVRFPGDVLWSVGSVMTGSAKPYQVFTPFWNRASDQEVQAPVDAPGMLRPPHVSPKQIQIDDLGLLDTVDWAAGFRERWKPGEPQAKASFEEFLRQRVDHYHETRNELAILGWSQLSAPIQFGELSVRRMWHRLRSDSEWIHNAGVKSYIRQLGWRDFSIHLMNHFPHMIDQPFRKQFERFPWVTNEEYLSRWQRGMTGYPIVDAAMRNLWVDGWMPNRARMIVGSFLCKDLLISWEHGAAWFWDTLVDAHLENNTFGWQWIAGCGADAAPYFRVFNPVSQGKKFDPDGAYVRKWVPELAELSSSAIHSPWEAAPIELLSAGVTLGVEYPYPIVDHAKARVEALEAYESIKSDSK